MTMPRVRVQEADFDLGRECTALLAGRADIGGLGCFVGVVRADPARSKPGAPRLAALTLEHYPGMTERAIGRIAEDASRRWNLLGCTVIHRVGRLIPGENIVLVIAAASHRQPALDATGFLIDWLKTRAPFWKRETFDDGSARWVGAREADEAAAARW
jgi:molybdopterin synthase catalytic subunit